FDPLTIESKKAATVVLMLNSPEEEILAKACEAIYKFALKGEENKATLLELGAVEPLTKLLTHEDKIVRRNATMIFGILASNKEVVIHEFASLCLANLSVEYTGKVQIYEHGGLEPLIRLLSSPDPDVKKNSIECIYNLVQDFQCRTTLHELNPIPPILELLKSEYPIIQLLALKTLGVITCDKESRAMLKENQGLDQLSKILETKEWNDLHVEALAVIANCLEDMDTVVLMQQTGILRKLLSFAENSTVPDIQKNSAKAITKAAYDGIPQIVQLLRSDNEEVREAAALALANLTTSSSANANAAAEADAIDPLINILSSKRDGAIANAATVLTNMAIQEPLRSIIQGHDVMQALLAPLHSTNTVVQSTAALTVASTACDVEARNQLRNCGGLEPLVELLHSKNDEVRRHASWAVMVCASDEVTAVELCKLGKGRGKKEEEKVKEEEEILAVPKLTEGSSEKEWYPPPDPELCVYVYEVTKSILPIVNIKDQIEALAKFVADKMGGKIPKEKMSDFSWELHISELKFQLKSNVIPIGHIKKGIFYHRALLFKVLADKIGVGSCLVRGEYSRAWNEVKLLNEARKGIIGRLPPPEEYIVDLMFHPGALLKLRSKEADLYRFL
ncbi:Armadillo repeat-containing protein 3, partial [Cricetulus griseus]